ncbi:hypothetical protein AB8E26_04500 [Stenotrophomonas rhizophila]|uniref:hypothetical protein n=1 Tax=Stenotrophomonas rhizophila TaxID=216778 RepID=UPI003516241A
MGSKTFDMWDTFHSTNASVAENLVVQNAASGRCSPIDASHIFGMERINASLDHRALAAQRVLANLNGVPVDSAIVREIIHGDHDAMGREAVVSACVQLAVTDVDRFGIEHAGLAPLPHVPTAEVEALTKALSTYIETVVKEGVSRKGNNWTDCARNSLTTDARRAALDALRNAAGKLSAAVDLASTTPANKTMGRLAQLMMPGLDHIACQKQGICLSEAVQPGALENFINAKAGAAWTTVMNQWQAADTVGLFTFAGKLLHLLDEAERGTPAAPTPRTPAADTPPPARDRRMSEPMAGPVFNNSNRMGDMHTTVNAPDLSWIPALMEPMHKFNEQVLQLLREKGVGQPGPQGPAGERGEQGPVGARGEQGPVGARGEQGPVGARGEQGPVGARGEQGPVGARGEQGPVGARGEQGPVGARGEQGPVGARGEQGPVGARGEQGPVGARGGQGPVGAPVLDERPIADDRIGAVRMPEKKAATAQVGFQPGGLHAMYPQRYLEKANPGLRRPDARATESLHQMDLTAVRDNVHLSRRVKGTSFYTHLVDSGVGAQDGSESRVVRLTVAKASSAAPAKNDINHRGEGAEPRGLVNLNQKIVSNPSTAKLDHQDQKKPRTVAWMADSAIEV